MANFQQVYTTYPSPAMVINTPTQMGYSPYPQHPNMQPSYYPSVQPQIIQQPGYPSYYYQQERSYFHNNSSTLSQICMWILCLGACTYCCTEGCCGGDDCCCGGAGAYGNDFCGCC